MLRDGEIDLVYDASRIEERARYSWFSRMCRDEQVLLYIRREDAVRYELIHSFDDLLGSRAIIVALRNAWVGPDYARYRDTLLKTKRAYEVDQVAQGRGMLLMHHADVFIAPSAVTDYLKQQNEAGIVSLDWTVYKAPVYYLFSRKTVSAAQVEQFNHALAKVLQKNRKS